jgi:ABC-type microcin C transport system permease subunit YejB
MLTRVLDGHLGHGKMGVIGLTAALLGVFTTISLLVRLLFAAAGRR